MFFYGLFRHFTLQIHSRFLSKIHQFTPVVHQSCNYGIGLARRGKKVLLIDADSQGSLTVSLGEQDLTNLDLTLASLIYGVIMNRPLDPHSAILHHREGVDFIPSNFELSGVSTALTSLSNREFILKSIVDSLRGEYDYILIDCLPSLGLVAINSLVAADGVIIPCHPAYLSTKGLNILLRTIAKTRRSLNPQLVIDGILLTCVDVHTKNAKEIMQALRDDLGTSVRIFDTVIPRSVKVAECSNNPSVQSPLALPSVFLPVALLSLAFHPARLCR